MRMPCRSHVKLLLPLLLGGLIVYTAQNFHLVADTLFIPKAQVGGKSADNNEVKLKSVTNKMFEIKVIKPASLDPYDPDRRSMDPEKLTCQVHKAKGFLKNEKVSQKMTPNLCQKYCVPQNASFMGLMAGDTCLCSQQHGSGLVQKQEECDLPCAGDNGKTCGGSKTVDMYRIDRLDGNVSWTQWMSYPTRNQKTIRSRYRGCRREIGSFTECNAELERDFSALHESEEALEKRFVGCFTSGSFKDEDGEPSDLVTHDEAMERSGIPFDCIDLCDRKTTAYALIMERRCLCTTSLGWSQPTDACLYGLGTAVYSVNGIAKNTVALRFEPRRTEKLVDVVAHYRGGSTLTSALFFLMPGSLSVYELGKLFGSQWPDVVMVGKEQERSNIFLTKVFPAWFYCDLLSLPGLFFTVYPGEVEFNIGFESFRRCQEVARPGEVATMCSPFLQEKCLMSPVVSAKTVRILHAEEIKQAILRNPAVEFIHAVRDPRGMHASRAAMSSWYAEDTESRVRDSCWELNELHGVFQSESSPVNSHVILYEDIASNLTKSASQIYKSMKITPTNELKRQLAKLSGGHAHRKSGFDIVQENPQSRIHSWMSKKSRHVDIHKADESAECTLFFNYYKGYYKPLSQLLESP